MNFYNTNDDKIKPGMLGLPEGTGYKSFWFVIEGSNQQDIVRKLALYNCRRISYAEGLEFIENAPYKDRTLMICPDYKGRNYILGECLSDLMYEPEEMVEFFGSFYRVYMYATQRVSEAHYFGVIENGRILRYYRFDEEDIVSIGAPLPWESANRINLPKDFDELDALYEDEDDSGFTYMNEEIIVSLALEQTGVDENYPYTEVILGVLP